MVVRVQRAVYVCGSAVVWGAAVLTTELRHKVNQPGGVCYVNVVIAAALYPGAGNGKNQETVR